MVLLDPTEGREQHGHRAVLVVSPGAFNEAAKLPVILPITSGGEFRRLGCNPGNVPLLLGLHPSLLLCVSTVGFFAESAVLGLHPSLLLYACTLDFAADSPSRPYQSAL